MFLVIGLLVCIYLHYVFKLKILKLKFLLLPNDTLKTSGLLKKMVLEIILCGIFCPPYNENTFTGTIENGTYEYSLDSLINVVMLIKTYWVLRLY